MAADNRPEGAQPLSVVRAKAYGVEASDLNQVRTGGGDIEPEGYTTCPAAYRGRFPPDIGALPVALLPDPKPT